MTLKLKFTQNHNLLRTRIRSECIIVLNRCEMHNTVALLNSSLIVSCILLSVSGSMFAVAKKNIIKIDVG
jgi:hypothetical protein